MTHPHTFRLVRDGEKADFSSVRVTIFRGARCGKICAWYISPTNSAPITDGYLPASSELIASVAILRALEVAVKLGVTVCIVDPDDLWAQTWDGG